jgi:hypothetical protein
LRARKFTIYLTLDVFGSYRINIDIYLLNFELIEREERK